MLWKEKIITKKGSKNTEKGNERYGSEFPDQYSVSDCSKTGDNIVQWQIIASLHKQLFIKLAHQYYHMCSYHGTLQNAILHTMHIGIVI